MSGSYLLRDTISTVAWEFSPRRVVSLRIAKRSDHWEWCSIRGVSVGVRAQPIPGGVTVAPDGMPGAELSNTRRPGDWLESG